jgi:hypothetical protein
MYINTFKYIMFIKGMFDLQFDQKEREKKQHLFVKNVEIQQHIVVKMFYRGILCIT